MNIFYRLMAISILIASTLPMYAQPALSVVMPDTETRMIARAYHIMPVSKEAIDKQHQALVQELKFNTLARYGVKAATAAVLVYIAYELLLSRTRQREYVMSADQAGLKELTNAQLTAAIYEMNPPGLSWQWFKNGFKSIGWGVINIALAKGVFDRIEQSIDSVMHNRNLEWFITTHTNCVDVITELTVYAHSHDTPGVAEREHAHHKEQILQVTQSFMIQMTALLGYMSYNVSAALDPQIRMNMHMLMEYFHITCDEFAQAMTKALEEDTAVTPHIDKINVELHRVLQSFKRLERELTVQ